VKFFSKDIYQCQHGTEIYGHLHRESEEETLMTIVLAEEDQHGLIENVDIAIVGLPSGSALIVDNRTRQIPVLPTSLQESVREIDVFSVHEKVLVEETNLFECLTT
jgi:type IV secretory pathway protease TraF